MAETVARATAKTQTSLRHLDTCSHGSRPAGASRSAHFTAMSQGQNKSQVWEILLKLTFTVIALRLFSLSWRMERKTDSHSNFLLSEHELFTKYNWYWLLKLISVRLSTTGLLASEVGGEWRIWYSDGEFRRLRRRMDRQPLVERKKLMTTKTTTTASRWEIDKLKLVLLEYSLWLYALRSEFGLA